MLALAEKLSLLNVGEMFVEEEAKELGLSVERFRKVKQAFEDTYSVVTDTFEKGYCMPKKKRRGWLACGNY